MNRKKINRYGHVGKSMQEKEVYKRFLYSKFELDKTEQDPIDINKTNESSYEEDETLEIKKIQKKSFRLRIKDFVNNNWFITIVGGIIVTIIVGISTFLIRVNVNQKIYSVKINNIEESVKEIKEISNENKSGLSVIKQNFEVFKVEITKDLDFIKRKINF